MSATKMISRSVRKQISGWTAVSLRTFATASYLRPVFTAQRYAQLATSNRRCLTSNTSNTFAPEPAVAADKRPTVNVFEQTSDRLPPLPVPNLNETLERLKETIWPIAMNSHEFANALDLIEAFSGSAGQKLDLLLRAKASQTRNWLSHDWWLQETYLKSRKSLVINSNPALIYPQLPFKVQSQRHLIVTCAQLISSIVDFKLALQSGWNPEQTVGDSQQRQLELNSKLCFDQYRRIFGSTRVPGEHVDSFKPQELREDETHFNLICAFRGQFYEIKLEDVSNEQGRVDALESVLSKIISFGQNEQPARDGPGVLTTMTRDLWAQSIKLIERHSLAAIEQAHLVFCLDTIPNEPKDSFARLLIDADANSAQFHGALARQMLHGDRANVGNRWFDKSLQLIVVADADCSCLLGSGINYEHCIGEAVVLTKLIEFSHAKLVEQQQHQNHRSSGSSAPGSIATFRQLEMGGPNELQLGEHMQRAKQDFVSQIDQFDLSYFAYKNYGRGQVKSWHFSPDSWFQIALQLAHFQLHNRLGPCYESASTRRFAYGRTETIRSLTKDVAQFCLKPSYETMLAAARSHKDYAQAANCGSAIDRVLLGYRLVFNELKANEWAWGLPTFTPKEASESRPLKFTSLADTQRERQVDLNNLFTEKELSTLGAFFNNELFERAKRFSLSTSQVSSFDHPSICTSYGPLVPDGYACCYNLSRNQMVAAITANSSNQSFSCEANKFSESLRDSLDQMKDIVLESQQQQQHQARDEQQHQKQRF